MLSGALDEVRVTNESICKIFSAMSIGRKVFKKYFGERAFMGSTLARCSTDLTRREMIKNHQSQFTVLASMDVSERPWTVCLVF